MEPLHWIGNAVYLSDLVIRTCLSARVIMRRLPVGVSLAWLAIILIFPFFGAALYLLVGEYRLGPGRARRVLAYRASRGRDPAAGTAAPAHALGLPSHEAMALARLAESMLGAVPLAGNRLQLLENAYAAFPVLIADIDNATRSCFLEFYIWSVGGLADELGAALVRAAQRGVDCRVLVDALGSGAFLKSRQCRELRQGRVRVEAALRFGLLRLVIVRPDLRMHRKIGIIDNKLAYTGSMNVADPRLFKQKAGVGQWVDALARLEGPVVAALAEVFREDWFLETEELVELAAPGDAGDAPLNPGTAAIQVMPTGPGDQVEAIEQVVLMAIYAARQEIVLTTPYFIPSESLLTALLSAAGRGVKVTLIVPAKIDSRLVHFASRAFQVDLLKAGVQVALFQGGLLHTKSITVDGAFSLFGSLNLDPRSFRLDLEITMTVYDAAFTQALRGLQQFYISGSQMLDLAACQARSALERFTENTARLVGPVL
jgi:cardiolipin synthase